MVEFQIRDIRIWMDIESTDMEVAKEDGIDPREIIKEQLEKTFTHLMNTKVIIDFDIGTVENIYPPDPPEAEDEEKPISKVTIQDLKEAKDIQIDGDKATMYIRREPDDRK